MKTINKILHLPILIEQDEDNFYIVSCPVYKGCHSYGKTIEEALDNIKEVIDMCVDEEKDKQGSINRISLTCMQNLFFDCYLLVFRCSEQASCAIKIVTLFFRLHSASSRVASAFSKLSSACSRPPATFSTLPATLPKLASAFPKL